MARRARGGSKTARKIDFNEAVAPFKKDEDVHLRVKEARWEDGDKAPYIAFTFAGAEGSGYEESEGYHNASTSPKALWRLQALLEALGQEVDGEMEIDTDELVDLECMAHTVEETYEKDDGSTGKSIRFDDFWPLEKKGKSSSKKGDDKPAKGKAKKDEPEKLVKEDVEKMDREELEALIEEHELDVDPTSRKLKKDDDALLEAVLAALEEGDLLEEEEEEKPAKGRRGKAEEKSAKGKKSKDKTWSEDEIQDMDEDDLEKVIEEAEIEVDLSEHRTLRKKKNAVIDALSDADKLDK